MGYNNFCCKNIRKKKLRGKEKMLSKRKRLLIRVVALSTAVMLLSACNKSTNTSNPKNKNSGTKTNESTKPSETVELTFGTHWQPGDDPDYVDPVTGKSTMPPDQLQARKKAAETVLKDLNVKIKWVQYSADTREVLLTSVLANDPVCDIALMWGGSQGTILAQNVLQPLDDYKDIFADEDTSWMFSEKIFGHNYLLNYILNFSSFWPLTFNIQYLDKVDALKENGKTVYPTDLWKGGKWTWSKFEEYLTKVNEYYANKKAPVRTDVPIKAFQTDYRYTATQAIHSNGGTLYGANGLGIDSPEAKQAVEYIQRLMDKKLMMSVRYGDDTPVPGWTWNASDFGNGETVFTNMVPWMAGAAGQELAKRGESMGIVPFPRPDNIPADDPKYQQVVTPDNQMGVLKGLSKEKTELALKAYKLYWSTYYKTLSSSDKVLGYLEKNAETSAVGYGLDILNESIGGDILDAYKSLSGPINEYGFMMPWSSEWSDNILGKSLYGLDGVPKYATAVDAQKNKIVESISSTEAALKSDKVIDNMPPAVSLVGKKIALSAGTDGAKVKWDKYIKAHDSVDGDIALSKATLDYSSVKFGAVGNYDKGLSVAVKDNAGNEGKAQFAVAIYNPKNTTPPTLKAKAEYRKIKKDEDASKINWAADFVESAADKDGLDLKEYVTADISKLDVTTAGTYEVVLSVTDYVGNKGELKINVTVE